jgi:chromosome condensin MukBEF MukE localization factor
MENDTNGKLNFLKFLAEPDAQNFFGEVDYYLKDGIHIQEYGYQIPYYRFLRKHRDNLEQFYTHYYGIKLVEENTEGDSYFFLDFNKSSRIKIPWTYRDVLKNEYAIIGIITYKIIYHEGNLELNSISQLQEMIRNDYEEYKEGLIKLLAQSGSDIKLSDDDDRIDAVVHNALKSFKRLGWMDIDQDYFEPRISFNRINLVYEKQIKDIDNIIANYQ